MVTINYSEPCANYSENQSNRIHHTETHTEPINSVLINCSNTQSATWQNVLVDAKIRNKSRYYWECSVGQAASAEREIIIVSSERQWIWFSQTFSAYS